MKIKSALFASAILAAGLENAGSVDTETTPAFPLSIDNTGTSPAHAPDAQPLPLTQSERESKPITVAPVAAPAKKKVWGMSTAHLRLPDRQDGWPSVEVLKFRRDLALHNQLQREKILAYLERSAAGNATIS